jgi:hypothetical protein
MLREEHRLRVFEKGVLRRLSGCEVGIKLCNDAGHNFTGARVMRCE